MSGQYPPPNPPHPFNRPPIHQRASPGLPPWGHPPQNTGMNMGGSMNFYGSPHLELPNRGLQQWSHRKPSPANPLFGLSRLPSSPTQQEETMDLSNTRLEANGTEVNGEVRAPTSVIATNPLRDSFPAAVNPLRNPPGEHHSFKSVLIPTGMTKLDSPEQNSFRDVSGGPLLFPERTFHSNIDALAGNAKEGPNLDSIINKSISEMSNQSNQSQSFNKLNINDSHSVLESSSVSERTDSSKVVVAESSAEDIFDMDNKNMSVPEPSQDTDRSSEEHGLRTKSSENTSKPNAEDIFGSEKHDSVFETTKKSEYPNRTESLLSKIQETTTVSSSNDKWLSKSSMFQTPAASTSETHPSVENVETLLESMFNSQEETSCSSQTSNSSLLPSVIVTNGARLNVPVEVPKPQVDVVSPMKADELALTLAEDHPPEVKAKEEKKAVKDELMDEIEKELEMLTESSSNDKVDSATKLKTESVVKIETDCIPLTAENVVSALMSDDVTPTVKTVDNLKSEVDVEDSSSTHLNKDVEHLEEKVETPGLLSETGPSEAKVHAGTTQKTGDGTSSNPFIEVESELEKMFAGIVEPADDVNSDNASQPSTSDSKKLAVNKRTVAKRKKPNSRRPSENSTFGEASPAKKKGRKRINESGSERGVKKFREGLEPKRGRPCKDTNGDASKVKGPFVHIEGSKLSPASVVVVNSGVRVDDDDSTDKASGRRKSSILQRSEAGSKRTGPVYSSSAMSARYNSDKADLTWVCVFCKRGPHCAGGLAGQPAGDLFGPYRIPTLPPHDDTPPPGQVRDKELVEEQKRRGGKYPKSLRASGGADQFVQKMAKKNKRSGSLDSVEGQAGLLLLDNSYEVWVHEQCAEWAPGLCIIGSQLVGLDEAVWTALRTRCAQCAEMGADIGCVVHNCPTRVHYPCAISSGWHLDTDTFIARCHNHRTRLRPS